MERPFHWSWSVLLVAIGVSLTVHLGALVLADSLVSYDLVSLDPTQLELDDASDALPWRPIEASADRQRYPLHAPGSATRVGLFGILFSGFWIILIWALDRRSDRPTSIFAVTGAVLVVLGGLALVRIMNEVSSSGGWLEVGLGPYRVTFLLWTCALACGVWSLPGLLWRRHRGALLSACAIAVPLGWGWIIYAVLIRQPPTPVEFRDVNLAVSAWIKPDKPDPDDPASTLRVTVGDRGLSLAWSTGGVWRPEVERHELTPLVRDLVVAEEESAVLQLAVDRTIRVEQMEEVLTDLRAGGLSKLQLIALVPASQPLFGKLSTYLDPDEGVGTVRLTRDGVGPVLEVAGQRLKGPAVDEVLRSRSRGAVACSLRVDGDLTWQELISAFDALFAVQVPLLRDAGTSQVASRFGARRGTRKHRRG
ncbi:MAG: hypothetical protein GY711_21080 [bacterium]|nr:hypothetical protein [bacterium]